MKTIEDPIRLLRNTLFGVLLSSACVASALQAVEPGSHRDEITVRFRATGGNETAAVYGIRVIRAEGKPR